MRVKNWDLGPMESEEASRAENLKKKKKKKKKTDTIQCGLM